MPLGSGGAQYGQVFSPPVARCLALYCDFLINCPLDAEDENTPLYRLLTRRPCPFMSRANFYRLCVERYFIFNGFFSIIKTNDRGEILALLPYASPQAVQVYPVNFKKSDKNDPVGDWGDPEKLWKDGFYFRDYRARTYTPDQMFYIRSAGFNTSTGLVEQEDVGQRVFNNTFGSASKLEAVTNALCSRDLRPPLMLSGLGFQGDNKTGYKASAKETDDVKKALRMYFDGESQSKAGVLALPPGYTVSSMAMQNPANVLLSINEVVTANVCNIFNVPRSLVFSGSNERDTKEARRIFIAGGFKAFTKLLTDEFDRLAGYENKFTFNLDKLRIQMADLREESALAQMSDTPP